MLPMESQLRLLNLSPRDVQKDYLLDMSPTPTKRVAISFSELEIRITDKGDKTRDVPILRSLANELRLHLGGRESGYVFPSPRGGHYSARRLQQLVKEIAAEAGITKNVYPHLLRHTMAQYLADQGMPENLLQKFLGHEHPASTQVYYEPARTQVKRAFQDAMGS